MQTADTPAWLVAVCVCVCVCVLLLLLLLLLLLGECDTPVSHGAVYMRDSNGAASVTA